MADSRDQDRLIMSAVVRLLGMAPGERTQYVKKVAGDDPELQREILESVQWEEQMGNFLQRPVASPVPASGDRLRPGELVGDRFEVVREIGEGGMGVVYEAIDRKRKQSIALKFGKRGCTHFLTPELQGALRVRHPNVCLVNEVHTAEVGAKTLEFLTMELLRGEPLTQWVSGKKRLSFSWLLTIASQLCSGLQEAHRCGVVHRDLKPANIMICPQTTGDLRTVITDFGLASENCEQRSDWGTPAYMAPELWRGASASAATDLYALGVILHELLVAHTKRPDSEQLDSEKAGLDQAEFGKAQLRAVRKLADGLVNLDPARRRAAFDSAQQVLRRARVGSAMRVGRATRVVLVGLLVVLGYGLAQWRQDAIRDWLHPLPRARFVAVLNGSRSADSRSQDLTKSLANALQGELARAERVDRYLFVMSTDGWAWTGNNDEMNKLRSSLGATLALVLRSKIHEQRTEVELDLVDLAKHAVLRSRRLICEEDGCRTLRAKALLASAGLLGIDSNSLNADHMQPATQSLVALSSFERAEELRKEPNDRGLAAAIELLRSAVEADPQYALAHAELARAYCRLYDLRGDASILEFAHLNAQRALVLNEKLPEAHAALAYAYERTGREEEALQAIRRARRLDDTDPRILLWEADIYLHFNRLGEAEKTYQQLEMERPNYWLPYQQSGVLFSEQGRYREAEAAFHSATLAAPWSALGFANLGMMLLKEGRLAEAEDNFRRSLALNAQNDGAHVNWAEALRDRGQYAAAVWHLQEAIRLNASDDQTWLGLADCYERMPAERQAAQHAYRRAEEEVERLLATEPLNGAALMRLALYQAKSHLSERAASSLAKAESAGIHDIDSQLVKARVLAVLHRRQQAAEHVNVCLRRGATPFEIASMEDLSSLSRAVEGMQQRGLRQ